MGEINRLKICAMMLNTCKYYEVRPPLDGAVKVRITEEITLEQSFEWGEDSAKKRLNSPNSTFLFFSDGHVIWSESMV